MVFEYQRDSLCDTVLAISLHHSNQPSHHYKTWEIELISCLSRQFGSYVLVQTYIWNIRKIIAKIRFLLSNYLVISD